MNKNSLFAFLYLLVKKLNQIMRLNKFTLKKNNNWYKKEK